MAQGWDIAWAEAALELGLPVICAVPCEGHDQPLPPGPRRLYRSILERAKDVQIVSEGGHRREKSLARNRWMVDRCDRLTALWNGGRSGTGYTVRYAAAKGRPSIICGMSTRPGSRHDGADDLRVRLQPGRPARQGCPACLTEARRPVRGG